ncbi:MAG: DUF1800 domain-containing protein [Planctomycetota bacterium]|jgi:uncharacterized protein (DUF1800 family)
MALLDPYDGPWGPEEAAHLARRAGFGASPDEVDMLTGMGMEAAVDSFIDYDPLDAALDAQMSALPDEGENNRLQDPQDDASLQGWWLYRMVHSTRPLQEQFTLFLHDTLVSAYEKVKVGVTNKVNKGNDGSQDNQQCELARGGLPPDNKRKVKITARLMKEQNHLLRRNGHGHYRQLLRSITRDPAMLIYLDNRLNKKGKAQENYAREIMELFSMGVGNYTEEDVREVARAFTGETINARCADNWPYSYTFDAGKHDGNPKAVFRHIFNFGGTGEDTNYVIDLILDRISNATDISPAHATHPAAALYMSWKILTWFVGESIAIEDPAVPELAEFFYANPVAGDGYHVGQTLRRLFKSQLFYLPEYRYTMYKHPADFVVMALRNLQLHESSYTGQARSFLDRMGMRLFSPPNVAGWNHGQMWVNSGYLLNRYNYADRLSSSAIATDEWVDGLISVRQRGHDALIEFFRARLIQTALRLEEHAILKDFLSGIQNGSGSPQSKYRRKIRGLIHLMMALPRYQLK